MTERGWIRQLGSTGLAVSALCWGTSPLGGVPNKYGKPISDAEALELVRRVFASPIRFVDTSNGYSEGRSELRLGAGMAAGGLPEGVIVATKVDARGSDYSAARVRESVRESSERLGMDWLPLVYLHDPEYHDVDALTARGGAVDALVALREEGRIGHIGVAGGNVGVMQRMVELGVFEVLLTHNRWTLVDRSAGDLIARAHDRGMGIVNAAVFGGGILARGAEGGGRYGYRPGKPETIAAIQAIAAECDRRSVPITAVALQGSMRDPRIHSTVVGFTGPDRIASLLAAATTVIDDDLWAAVEEYLPLAQFWLDTEATA